MTSRSCSGGRFRHRRSMRRLAAVAAAMLVVAACSPQVTGLPTPATTLPAPSVLPPPSDTSSAGSPAPAYHFAVHSVVDAAGGITVRPAAGSISPTVNGSCVAGLSIAVGAALEAAPELSLPLVNSSFLAFDDFVAANRECRVSLRQFDALRGTSGDPPGRQQIADDQSIVGVVGPIFSDEVRSVGYMFDSAGLLAISPSATAPILTRQGWTIFKQAVANDAELAPGVVRFLIETLRSQRVCVITERADWLRDIASQVTTAAGSAALTECSLEVTTPAEIDAAGDTVQTVNPDAVFLSAELSTVTSFVEHLRSIGTIAPVVVWDAVDPRAFIDQAGPLAQGVYLACGCQLPSESFDQRYLAKFGQHASSYAEGTYEVTLLMLNAIGSGSVSDRESMRAYFADFSGSGAYQTYQWDPAGEPTHPLTFIYEVTITGS